MLIQSIKDNFTQIIDLLNQLDENQYCFPNPNLSNASIGEHTRHIIEMYQVLLQSYSSGIVNYDKRERNIAIQTCLKTAKNTILSLIDSVDLENKTLQLEQGTSTVNFKVETNYFRELLYNLEHSIHHQALIKVAVFQNPNIQLHENFGVAKSTIEYRIQCAQ